MGDTRDPRHCCLPFTQICLWLQEAVDPGGSPWRAGLPCTLCQHHGSAEGLRRFPKSCSAAVVSSSVDPRALSERPSQYLMLTLLDNELVSKVYCNSLGATFSHRPGKPRIKKTYFRTSLMAQWIGICMLMQGTQVRSLAWDDPTYCGAAKPTHQNYRSLRALEPRLCRKRSRAPQLESSPTVCSRRRPPTRTSTAKNKCIQEKKV